jgi:formyl-CoA transferase
MLHDLPLAGVVVVELGDSASAPFAGHVLAALGAEVWKVERPSGDSSRGWGPSQWKGCAAAFHALNRGKRCISIDIKDVEQLATLHRLIAEHADVFIHNLRPGSADKYGLDADSLRVTKPELICCELGAFGHTGPLSEAPGYDPAMQAFAGIMNLTGEEGQGPVRAGVSIIDFGSGMWSVIGILAALFRRQVKHTGASVNSSLLETALAWMSINIANFNADGDPGGRHGSGAAIIVPHRAYAVADGYLVVSAANDRLFAKMCAALGHPEWARDERFTTNAARLRNREAIDRLIGECLAKNTRAYWMEYLQSLGVATAPVQTTQEVVRHEQTRALGILGKPDAEEIGLVGLPLSFDGKRPPPLHSAYGIGHDNGALKDLLEGGAMQGRVQQR